MMVMHSEADAAYGVVPRHGHGSFIGGYTSVICIKRRSKSCCRWINRLMSTILRNGSQLSLCVSLECWQTARDDQS